MSKFIKQVLGFVGLSGIGWLLDFGTYTLLGFISKNPVLNNCISSWVGVTFVFFFATRKLFENNSKISLKWKYVIYLVYQAVLIFLISKLLGVVNEAIITYVTIGIIKNFSTIVAKIVVTPVTMIMNFFVMKGVIEKL